LTRQKNYKFDKNFVPPVTPGDESLYKTRVDIEKLVYKPVPKVA